MFGYPGGAVLPIYDALFQHPKIRHVLVRHEAGAAHAAEGYARSTGKPGVVLVTSGPGATNAVTGIADAFLDSIPHGCHHRTSCDQADRLGCLSGSRHHRHHPPLHQAQLSGQRPGRTRRDVVTEAFHIATNGRPGPVVIDIPKNVQVATHRI